jgi:hypothetical protein
MIIRHVPTVVPAEGVILERVLGRHCHIQRVMWTLFVVGSLSRSDGASPSCSFIGNDQIRQARTT